MRNPNKVFGAHENIFWSISKLDYARRKVGTSSRKSWKNSQKVCKDWLTDEELKGVIWVTKKRFWEAPNKSLSWESRNLILEKDKSMPEREDRPTKRILKTLLTLNRQRSNKQTSHQAKSHQINSGKFEDSHFSYN